MEKCRVLLLGESYSATHTFVRGRNYVTLPQYGHFGTEIAAMLEKEGFDVTLIVTHDIPEKCPVRREDFGAYDVVILSDVGSDTMLTQPPNQEGKRNPNRLQELAGYVEQGGGVVMVGGYFSFSGIGNQARYNLTPLAKALPVSISNYDDRVECPEGVFVEVTYSGNTRLFEGIRMEDCPPFGGYNKTVIKEDAIKRYSSATQPARKNFIAPVIGSSRLTGLERRFGFLGIYKDLQGVFLSGNLPVGGLSR